MTISFRIREAPINRGQYASHTLWQEDIVITLAKHLTSDEEQVLFLLGGSNDLLHRHFEQTLIQQHIPRREDADSYDERVLGMI
jgi:energy-converting hydrogenase A subunit M